MRAWCAGKVPVNHFTRPWNWWERTQSTLKSDSGHHSCWWEMTCPSIFDREYPRTLKKCWPFVRQFCALKRACFSVCFRFTPHPTSVESYCCTRQLAKKKNAETIYFYSFSSNYSDHRRSVNVYQSVCCVAESPLAFVFRRNCRMTMLLSGRSRWVGACYSLTKLLQIDLLLAFLFFCERKAVPVQWRSDVN